MQTQNLLLARACGFKSHCRQAEYRLFSQEGEQPVFIEAFGFSLLSMVRLQSK